MELLHQNALAGAESCCHVPAHSGRAPARCMAAGAERGTLLSAAALRPGSVRAPAQRAAAEHQGHTSSSWNMSSCSSAGAAGVGLAPLGAAAVPAAGASLGADGPEDADASPPG